MTIKWLQHQIQRALRRRQRIELDIPFETHDVPHSMRDLLENHQSQRDSSARESE
ncbi:hypothetical protein Fbal_2779 [Ferrimonas balearica DSM 9799]|uniref:Uncharacterized protein n=1 Tax=Ferrimonas balearica (strain DSM 9799 / CCM 4581 / KCTC 23876 / PAT) TaxID=550540 RepID=E1SRR0_FERBD|nr:hypothetical protein [Ferrimonas balearica]MBY6017477.1 hypothetical protein [Halomonas denitrificans]ADN76981.1 hypothetical protein Fbal_2779 [Ferrimonas balearica DSM 9799]MBW3140024.1 hypothetical protein [Ferrimonas balearica]MBW3165048.1 hypothetical protein [Ferrimonas balearica]MBY5980085.1 hypothetical protein [Ferrimonas balearica]